MNTHIFFSQFQRDILLSLKDKPSGTEDNWCIRRIWKRRTKVWVFFVSFFHLKLEWSDDIRIGALVFLHGACSDWWQFSPPSQGRDRGNWRLTGWTRHQHSETWQKLPLHGSVGRKQGLKLKCVEDDRGQRPAGWICWTEKKSVYIQAYGFECVSFFWKEIVVCFTVVLL